MRRDYWIHLAAGVAIAFAVGILSGNVSTGLMVGVLAGVAKEVVWDMRLENGRFEWNDMACTAVGSCLGALLVAGLGAV